MGCSRAAATDRSLLMDGSCLIEGGKAVHHVPGTCLTAPGCGGPQHPHPKHTNCKLGCRPAIGQMPIGAAARQSAAQSRPPRPVAEAAPFPPSPSIMAESEAMTPTIGALASRSRLLTDLPTKPKPATERARRRLPLSGPAVSPCFRRSGGCEWLDIRQTSRCSSVPTALLGISC